MTKFDGTKNVYFNNYWVSYKSTKFTNEMEIRIRFHKDLLNFCENNFICLPRSKENYNNQLEIQNFTNIDFEFLKLNFSKVDENDFVIVK